MLKIQSPLPEDLERLAERVIGSCVAVHRVLGPGLVETIYSRAVALELEFRGISFEREKPIAVRYRGELLCHQRLDMLVGGSVVLELVARLRLGLLVNFNVPILKYGIRRAIL